MKKILVVSLAAAITGCAATGANLKGNVYKAGDVNKDQEAKMVTIKNIGPAQIEVDNSEQKQKAQIGGAALGALAGGLGVGLGTGSAGAGVGGAAGGGALGAAAGSMVDDKVLVEGVSLAYVDETGKIHTSAQVGRPCEFKEGKALLVSTGAAKETRIQPNNPNGCPPDKK